MELKEIRKKIDELDDEFCSLFIKRMALSREVAKSKMLEGGSVNRPGREEEIVNRLSENAEESMKPYIRELYSKIFDISKDYQNTIINEGKE